MALEAHTLSTYSPFQDGSLRANTVSLGDFSSPGCISIVEYILVWGFFYSLHSDCQLILEYIIHHGLPTVLIVQ